VLEKPLGHDLASASDINGVVRSVFREEQALHIEIKLAEQIGFGMRGDFYDRTGALRDMIQNHALQLLMMIAMEPPSRNDANAIRDEKLKVLHALKPFTADSVRRDVVGGQYRAGTIAGTAVPVCTDETMVPSGRRCESFVALRAELQNWRWAGVPFYLRTGKRLGAGDIEHAVSVHSKVGRYYR